MGKKLKSQEASSPSQTNFDIGLSSEAKRGIFTVFLFALAVICGLGLAGGSGQVGNYLREILANVFGWSRYLVPLLLVFAGFMLFFEKKFHWRWVNFVGIFLFALSFNGLLHLLAGPGSWEAVLQGSGGGALGAVLAMPLIKYFGFWASLVILVAFFIASFLLMFNTSLSSLILRTKEKHEDLLDKVALKAKEMASAGSDADDDVESVEETVEVSSRPVQPPVLRKTEGASGAGSSAGSADKADDLNISTKKFLRKVDLPLELLDNKVTDPSGGDIRANQYIIHKTLENFGIPVEMGDVAVGPTVTQYTLKPADGIKLNRITALSNDLALSLAAHPIRIEAPIPGKSLIGEEVPNKSIAMVRLREIMTSRSFKSRKTNLTIGLGKDVSGEVWVSDITKMPHLLVAGATGSGKSVFLNTLIISLIYQNGPEELKFIMVDPKRVELTVYNRIPHLLTPVITDTKKTVNALKWMMGEMDRRYEVLSKSGARNIVGYNSEAADKLPYIVLVVDELADLMVAAGSAIEGSIIRLAQMSRAVGIHLVLATQRPSVDVLTGLIKANIPTRVAFSVPSLMDSRTILDAAGAEKLVGRGDMLYVSPELSKPKRLQGAYLSDSEINQVVDYLAKEVGEPQFVEEVTNKPVSGSGGGNWDSSGGDDDELLDDARKIVIEARKASASFLQRRLKVGYARAARLLDLLQEEGIIGPGEGAKPREVLVSSYEVSGEPEDPIVDSPAMTISEPPVEEENNG
ncbi:DNA translocase FtsK [Candidatus Uhrbacteria bacterium]|nr:DNA translocase FtsK [Candidatus Uhrbacteria bacterium]